MAKKIFKGIGKYLVFCLLNGLGGIVAASVVTSIAVNNFSWLLGHPNATTATVTFGACSVCPRCRATSTAVAT